MGLHIVENSSASLDEWDRIAASSSTATFFHSRAWALAWQNLDPTRYVPDSRLISFSDGTQVLLPVMAERRSFGVTIHWSGPGGVYGGWMAASPLSSDHRSLLVGVVRALGNSVWVSNPYDGATSLDPGPGQNPAHTLTLDLSAGFEAAKARWSTGHRRAARQARRSGVFIKVATSEDEWRGYYGAYQDSLRRWGPTVTSRYSWQFFRALAALGSEDVKLWIATVDGGVVAGALCLYDSTRVCYWHGASYEAAFRFRPSNLIFHDAIEEACRSGRQWFDLGSSGGHAGVEGFKRGFGPTRLEFSITRSLGPVASSALRLRSVSRRLQRRLR